MKINPDYNISFLAKPGSRLLEKVTKEFDGNKVRTDKYIKIFENTFKNITDEDTIIDIDKNFNYVFSSSKFQGIKYSCKSNISSPVSIPQKILNECSKTIAYGELMLFRNIISKTYLKEKSLDGLAQKAERDRIGKKFMSQLNLAEKILNKNPNSKLSNIDFDVEAMEVEKENLKDIANKIFNISG